MQNLRIVGGAYDGSLHGWHGTVSSPNDDKASLCDSILDSTELKFQYMSHGSCIKCVKIRKDRLVSTSTDQTFKVYDLQSNSELTEITLHSDAVNCADFLGDKHIVSGSADQSLLLWRTSDYSNIHTFKGHKSGSISSISVHPSSKFFFSLSNDNSIRMWDAASGKAVSRNLIPDFKVIDSCVWSESGKKYALICDRFTVLLLDVKNPEAKSELEKKFVSGVYSTCFCGDEVIAVGLEDGSVFFMAADSEDGEEVCSVQINENDGKLKKPRFMEYIQELDMLCVAYTDKVVRFFSGILESEGIKQQEKELLVGAKGHITSFHASFSKSIQHKRKRKEDVEADSGSDSD